MASTRINSVDLGPIWFQSGNGTPDHLGYKGSIYIDLDTAIEYINKDGLVDWEVNGGSNTGGTTTNQIEISSNQSVDPSWNNQQIIFTSSCTISIPNSLPNEFNFIGSTLNNVDVDLFVDSPSVWLFGQPATINSREQFSLIKQGSTNNILLYKLSNNNLSAAEQFISVANITNPIEINAVTNLVTALVTNNLWSKIKILYPFIGTNADNQKYNLKNPKDLDSAFRLNFTGGYTFSSNGYSANGNSYANTHLKPFEHYLPTSFGITTTIGTNNTVGEGYEIGTQTSTESVILGVRQQSSTNRAFTAIGPNSGNPPIGYDGETDVKGVWSGSRVGNTTTQYKNGIIKNFGLNDGILPNTDVWIGVLNLFGSPYGYSTQRFQTTVFHDGLTDSEIITLHSIIDSFESALGRKTW